MEKKQKGHGPLNRMHFSLAIILLLHSILYLIYWFAVPDFRTEIDKLISTRIGWELPFVAIFMGLTVLILLWSLARVVRFGLALRRDNWKPTVKNWLFFATLLLFLAIFYGSFWLILRAYVSQRGVVLHLLNIIRLFSDVLILLIVTVILWRLIKWVKGKFSNDQRKWPLRLGVILALILLIALWLVPVLFPPNWAYRGALPTKPAVIADGGAAMLAPENTLAAVDLAGSNDVFGFETTVHISSDGVPFLMRDGTFERTTNIAEVYPNRVDDPVSSFEINEIEDLNAGLWFIQTDPYNTIRVGKISQTQLSINQGQKIPTLAEALENVADQDMIVLLHLVRPSEGHPYFDEFFDIVLSICQESDLNDDIWLELQENQIRISQAESPQITRVLAVSSEGKPEPSDVLARGYEIIHTDTGVRPQTVRALREEGLGVNVHTINQSWLFSQFWLSGVTSISTTNVQTFNGLERPLINLPFTSYLLIWSLFGIVFSIWLASSFPLPERKVKPAEEIPTPIAPELEGAGQMPSIGSVMTSEETTPDELQLEVEIPGSDMDSSGESQESNQLISSELQVESFEPNETMDLDEEADNGTTLLEAVPTEAIEEADLDVNGQDIQNEDVKELPDGDQSLQDEKDVDSIKALEEFVEETESESAQADPEDENLLGSEADLELDQKE